MRGARILVGGVAIASQLTSLPTASAIPYETFVDIDDQSDLDDLLAAGDITQDTYDELLDLLQSGVDINTADRAELYTLPNLTYEDVDKIIAYRDKQNGNIPDPAALATGGVISEEKLLAIAPFLVTSAPGDKPLGIKGFLRAQTRWSPKDHGVPPLALVGRFSLQRHWNAGFASVLTRLEPGDPVLDPNRNALVADAPGYHLRLPKIYLKYEDENATVIAGSFRAGFGQRLVFDDSRKYTPNGLYSDDQLFYSSDLVSDCRESAGELTASPCAGDAGNVYVTPDWNWRDGLLGVGAGLKKIDLPTGWLQGFVWSSVSNRSIYQYELVNRDICQDPHDDSNPACAAPTVFVKPSGSNPLVPSPRFSFETLPNVFQERLAGANVTYFSDRRNSIGVTGYAATEKNLVSGVDLDVQEWSRLLTGHTFGTVGGNFAVGRGSIDVFGEVAQSFDKIPDGPGPQQGGGGLGAILRATWTHHKDELELVARYYSVDYANPYARPISAPDEFDGQRARDEMGLRVRYYTYTKQYSLRAAIDYWEPPSSRMEGSVLGRAQPKIDAYVRGDVRTTDQIRLGLWLHYQDKDLEVGGHEQCFEVPTDTNENGEPIPCGGRALTTIGRITVTPNRQAWFEMLLEHKLLDDPTLSMTAFRQDVAAWAIAHYQPAPGVRVRARVRYLNEAIEDNSYLETSVAGLVDAAFTLRTRDVLRARFDTKVYLDDRSSTAMREPSPEFQLWLSYEAKL